MTKIPDRPKLDTDIFNNQDILIGDLEPFEDLEPVEPPPKQKPKNQQKSRAVVSIRTKLLRFLMPTLLFSLFAIGAIAYSIIKTNTEKQLKTRSKQQSLLASNATSDFLEENLKYPELLARNSAIVAALDDSQSPEAIPQQNINTYLRSIAELAGAAEISLANVQGIYQATTLSTNQIIQQNANWWTRVEKDSISIAYSEIRESIDLIVRVQEPANKNVIGAIKYTIPTRKLTEISDYLIQNGSELSATQQVQIVDMSGNAIATVNSLGANNDRARIVQEEVNQIGKDLIKLLNNLSQQPTERGRDERILARQKELSNQYTVDNLEIQHHNFDTKENRSQLVLNASFKKGNTTYYISTIPSEISWLAVSSIADSDLRAATKEATLKLLAAIALLATAAALITWWSIRKISLPIEEIAKTAEQMTLGNLNLKADPEGEISETKVLAQSLNNLVAELQSLLNLQTSETKQSRLIAQISSCPSLNKVEARSTIERAIKTAREILTVERMLIYRFREDESGYIANEALLQPYPSSLKNDSLNDFSIPKRIIEEYSQGKVVAIEDMTSAKLDSQESKRLQKLQVKSFLSVPILTRGKLYGLAIAHHCELNHKWQEKEIIFAQQLTAQLGLLLERVEFLEERRSETSRSEHLKNITVKISAAIEAEDILETAVKESREVLNADRSIMYSFNGDRQGTVIAESVTEEWPQALGDEITDPGFIDRFLDSYQQAGVKAIPDIYEADLDRFHIQQVEKYGVKAKLIAPVLMGGELRGLLIAHQCSGPRNWDNSEIDFLNQVATQVGLALERANLLEQQRDAREYLQERALELLREVDPLSKGDLTIRARVTEDEIGTVAYSYNSTIESLQRIVNQVKAASGRVTSTTERNQISVEALSDGAISQRQQIEAALQEIQAMNSSIHAVAVNAERAESKVKQASQTVEAGEQAMNRTVAGIVSIQETVSATAEKVKQLGESSQKISQVVNLISTFAAQTNLLALKTSLEAARAGEEGRGFAVIADEIRSLAAQSAQKSDEIEKMVAKIQAETNEVVEAMKAGTSQVVTGTKLVDETRSSLEKISLVSNQINNLVEDIAKVAVKQAQTSQAVTERIAEVAKISNQTSTEAEQVSESFQELLSVAQSLQDSIGQFKVA